MGSCAGARVRRRLENGPQRSPSQGLLRWWVLAALSSLVLGCFPATFNVRAQRAFSNEEAVPETIVDRAVDIAETRILVGKLLADTPYTPADEWVQALGLENPEGERLKKEVLATSTYRGGELEVPTVKVIRLHLQKVSNQALAPRASKAAYPSLLAALETLTPGAKGLRADFDRYSVATLNHEAMLRAEIRLQEQLVLQNVPTNPAFGAVPDSLVRARQATQLAATEADEAQKALLEAIDSLARADLSHPMQDQIARDGLSAFSVALRAMLEAQALIPVVQTQSARAIESEQRVIFSTGAQENGGTYDLKEVPVRMRGMEAMTARDVPVFERATTTLSVKLGIAQKATPGFVFRESIVDQVFGVQWDSLHVHANLDGEVMFYNQIGTNGISGDYTGRTRRLAYSIAPIATIGGRIVFSFDWLHIQNAATLNGSFETDRFYSSNGSITYSGSLGQRLGLKGFASDVVDIGAGIIGIRTRVKNAKFTNGEVSEIAVDPTTGKDLGVVDKALLQIAFTQVDVAYDVAFALPPEVVGRYWIEELLVGFRYMNYRLPRILYELQDVNPPGAKSQNFKFERESPAQKITSNYYMGGGTFRFGQGTEHIVSLYGDLGFYGGIGTSKYTLTNDKPETPTAAVFDLSAGVGARLRLTPRKSRFRVLVEAQYHGEMVYQTVISSLRGTQTSNGTTYTVDKKVDFGGTDLFHGPRLQVVGVF